MAEVFTDFESKRCIGIVFLRRHFHEIIGDPELEDSLFYQGFRHSQRNSISSHIKRERLSRLIGYGDILHLRPFEIPAHGEHQAFVCPLNGNIRGHVHARIGVRNREMNIIPGYPATLRRVDGLCRSRRVDEKAEKNQQHHGSE